LTATILALLLLLKLLVLALSLNNARGCNKANKEDVLKGFAKKSTLAKGTRKNKR
jgi:hypothetical protein